VKIHKPGTRVLIAEGDVKALIICARIYATQPVGLGVDYFVAWWDGAFHSKRHYVKTPNAKDLNHGD